MIGRVEKTVLDCPDPRALAAFYAELLGMRVNEDEDDWQVIGRDRGWRELAFQRAETYVAPEGPAPPRTCMRAPRVPRPPQPPRSASCTAERSRSAAETGTERLRSGRRQNDPL